MFQSSTAAEVSATDRRPDGHLPGAFAVGGFAVFVLAVVTLHFVQPDHNPIANFISDYANGTGAWLLALGFVGATVGLVGLSMGVARCVKPARSRNVAVVAFAIAGLATLAGGVWPSDPPRADGTTGYTTTGAIHDLSGFVGFIAVVVALFALVRAFRRDPAWRDASGRVRVLAWVLTAGLVGSTVAGAVGTPAPDGDGVTGLVQRVTLGILITAALLFGRRLMRTDAAAGRRDPAGTVGPQGEPVGDQPSLSGVLRSRFAVLAGIAVMAVLGAWTTPAGASGPRTEVFTYEDVTVLPAGELCSVDITLRERGKVVMTEWYAEDGSLVKGHLNVNGTTVASSAYGEAVNRWVINGFVDAAGGLVRTGNDFNVHAGAGGVLVNDSGRIVTDEAGREVFSAGPRASDEEFGELCARLSP